jgi:hypothetical protein
MKIEDTVIESAGVYRCCLATVAVEHKGKEIEIGEKSQCDHCGEKFTLVLRTGDWKPIWKPDWQFEK